MIRNVGALDRAARILVGLVLIASPLGLYGADYATAWGWIGVLPLATGLLGTCPGYSVLGISTCAS